MRLFLSFWLPLAEKPYARAFAADDAAAAAHLVVGGLSRVICGHCQLTGDYCSCSLIDLLFNTSYAAQIFDWQNAVFLCFFPIMLGLAALIHRLTYSSSGDVTLGDVFKKAGDMHVAFADWGTEASLSQFTEAPDGAQVAGSNMGQEDGDEIVETAADTQGSKRDAARAEAATERDVEMTPIVTGAMPVKHTSTHPTDVDPRNIAVMITLSAFIISVGMICWAAISEFVSINSSFLKSGIHAQGFATQTLPEGSTQRGINIGWGLCWLAIGTLLMTGAQLIIRKVVMGANLNVVEAVLERGNIAAAICEAGYQIAMGLVVSASITGPPSNFGFDLAGCILFFVLGLLVLVVWSKIFDLYTRDWETWKEISRGNIAAAISQFCQMVSAGLLMYSAISKTFELATFFAWVVTGSVIRIVYRTLLDHFLIAPRFVKARYTSEELQIDKLIARGNWGAALVVGPLQIVLTHIINSFLPDSCTSFRYADGRLAYDMNFAEKLTGTEYLRTIYKWDRLVALCIIFGVFLLARVPYELRLKLQSRRNNGGPTIDPDLNFYIVEGRKHAITISFGGYLVAVGNMLVGIFKDANYNTSFIDSSDPAAWGYLFLQIAVGYVMIVAALFVSDVFILHKFDNLKLMTQYDNRAVALIEAGSLIGSSFIVGAVINGWDYSDPPYGSAVIFFFATQLLFYLFQLVFESVTAYDDEKEVQLGNASAGLNNGLNLVAVGMLLGRSTYLSHSLIMLVTWALVSFPLIFLARYVTDHIVLPSIHLEATIECLDRMRPDVFAPRRPCKQGNWGTALVAGAVTISLAQLLNTFLRDCPFALGIPWDVGGSSNAAAPPPSV